MTYLILFLAFFRIGLFGFGGGLAMLPLLYQSIQQFAFMPAEEFSDLLAISQVTPGPIIINAATYVGVHAAGIGGAACATIGVMLPSFIIMMIVSRFLQKFNDNALVKGAFEGIRPVTIGLVVSAAMFVGQGVLAKGEVISMAWIREGLSYGNLIGLGIMALAILLMIIPRMKPLPVMLSMAGLGAILGGTGVLG